MTDKKNHRCAVCAVPCIEFAVNGATLCDLHFDGWLVFRVDLSVPPFPAMAEYVARERAART